MDSVPDFVQPEMEVGEDHLHAPEGVFSREDMERVLQANGHIHVPDKPPSVAFPMSHFGKLIYPLTTK